MERVWQKDELTILIEEKMMVGITRAGKAGKSGLAGLILLGVVGLFGCGQGEVQYIQGFDYNIDNSVLDMKMRFNKNLELNTDFTVPILQYGSVSLLASSVQQGFAIGASLNLNEINDGKVVTLEKTRLLPNSQPMASYVQTKLARIRIQATQDVVVDVYLGLDDPEHYYVGVAVEFGFMNQAFPVALVMSQVINDQIGRPLGAVSIFGPDVRNGQLIASGGFFVVSNVSDLAKYIEAAINGDSQSKSMAMVGENGMITPPLKMVDKTQVNIQKYDDKGEQLKLYNLFQAKAQEAGLKH